MTTCCIGLALERSQLTTHFANEVLNAEQVCFSRFKTTLGFFFPFAVLENSGGFFDDGATIFCACSEHRIDLSLTDDDVLLATNAGVGQQFLHVKKSALDTVDGVLTVSVTEQNSRHCDFRKIKWQQTCGVVEREHDFGTTKSRTLLCSVEDDIFHLLASH